MKQNCSSMIASLDHQIGWMFQPDGHDVTFAEMSSDQKNGISHRADAFRKLLKACFD